MGSDNFRSGKLDADLYFLWTLERLSVIYSLDTIGDRDWYAWGAKSLLAKQKPNGNWPEMAGPAKGEEVPTCFAILFLRKANVARDLTAILRSKGYDTATLKGGDVETIPMAPKVIGSKDEAKPPPVLSGIEFQKEVVRLSAAVIDASRDERSTIVARYRDAKGGIYTEALARCAEKLADDAQREVRAALSKRLTRMTAATLREMLKDPRREIRLAAANASGLKEDRQLVPDLIEVIADAESLVVDAARTSLKSLSGQDFGPERQSSNEAKAIAQSAWKQWWKTQSK
jgi:hypothetical protein